LSSGVGTGAASVLTPLAAELLCWAKTGIAQNNKRPTTATNGFEERNMIPPLQGIFHPLNDGTLSCNSPGGKQNHPAFHRKILLPVLVRN
jgi:hypothetical protein